MIKFLDELEFNYYYFANQYFAKYFHVNYHKQLKELGPKLSLENVILRQYEEVEKRKKILKELVSQTINEEPNSSYNYKENPDLYKAKYNSHAFADVHKISDYEWNWLKTDGFSNEKT